MGEEGFSSYSVEPAGHYALDWSVLSEADMLELAELCLDDAGVQSITEAFALEHDACVPQEIRSTLQWACAFHAEAYVQYLGKQCP